MDGAGVINVRNSTILLGDVRSSLRTLPDKSVHCCVTSPPYWGLRVYGTEPQVWGGRADCEHVWTESVLSPKSLAWATDTEQKKKRSDTTYGGISCGACGACGAWRGELGSEPTIDQFVSNMLEVFAEVWRVLRDDGLLWLNIGDSYNGIGGPGKQNGGPIGPTAAKAITETKCRRLLGLKPKDLCGVPWRLVLALQAAGWYWRDTIVWHKPAPMPESVTDRCTKSWEPVFMLAKSEKYFADMQAVKESVLPESIERCRAGFLGNDPERDAANHYGDGFQRGSGYEISSRNLRNLWTITSEPISLPHFAAYPTALPARCIQISTSEKGVCPKCGAQWVRTVTTKRGGPTSRASRRPTPTGVRGNHNSQGKVNGSDTRGLPSAVTETIGWQPSCACNCEPIPATVLDPFLGSGSTSVAAERLGRHSIGCELNEKYAREIAVVRIQSALVTDSDFKQPKPLAGQKTLI